MISYNDMFEYVMFERISDGSIVLFSYAGQIDYADSPFISSDTIKIKYY